MDMTNVCKTVLPGSLVWITLLNAQQANERLTLVPMGLDALPKSGCSVLSFEPHNNSEVNLAGSFTGLAIARSLVPPNRYFVRLACQDGILSGKVLVHRNANRYLVSGRVGIIHESFGPGGVPHTKVSVNAGGQEAAFLLVSAATRADETFLTQISPEGVALLLNPDPGKYMFSVLSDSNLICTGVFTIENPKGLPIAIARDVHQPEFCRQASRRP